VKTLLRLLGLSGSLLSVCVVGAAELSAYRDFQFGMDLPAAARQLGMEVSAATVVHRRPAMIQELAWQPSSVNASDRTSSIKYGQLGFYRNELYRIVVTYDRDRVEGMTPDDMIAAISTTYGKATKLKVDIAYHSNYGEVAPVLARWENPEYSYNLVRSGYGDSFALVMYSKRLDTLAATAIAESMRLDLKEEPQRAKEAARKQLQEETSALDKARSANALNFRP
jgi:hypothetical protein